MDRASEWHSPHSTCEHRVPAMARRGRAALKQPDVLARPLAAGLASSLGCVAKEANVSEWPL